MPAGLTLPPPPNITEEELNSFDQDDPEQVAALVRKLAGSPADSTEQPAALWDRAALPYLMMEWLRHPRSEEEVLQSARRAA